MKEYNCPDCTLNTDSCEECPRCVYKIDNSYDYIRYVPMQPSSIGYENSSCKYCSNNPANGGSGICHCIMGNNVTY